MSADHRLEQGYHPAYIRTLKKRIAMLRISLEAIRDDGLSKEEIFKLAETALEEDEHVR